ncbi:MAG: hypothetical protein ABIN55_04385 [Aeromicrobium sp.]
MILNPEAFIRAEQQHRLERLSKPKETAECTPVCDHRDQTAWLPRFGRRHAAA